MIDDAEERLRQALSGTYELLQPIGRGGMATVYAAHDRKHARDVAIKVMEPTLARGLGVARFLRELRIAAGLTHPGIVPVFDSGEAAGTLFYVMPLLRGESFRARMVRAPIGAAEACTLLADVPDALDAAHRAGFVHRDVKPENIILEDARPLLADFAVAHAARTWFGEALTETGMIVGTALYMAPEQLLSDRNVDARADLFSVGAVLYEMLAGEPPYAAPTLPATLARLANEPPPPLRADVVVGRQVHDVLRRTLARNPDDRFATARELARALRAAAASEGNGPPSGRNARASQRLRLVKPAVMAAIAVGLLVLLLMVAARRGRLSFSARSPEGTPPSLAVLPFDNASDDHKLQYFSEGVADELQNSLADVAGLRVASRTSAEAWKGRATDAREIARALGVGALLEGSVRRSTGHVRVSVRLVDGRTGLQRWGQSYDRKLEDVFDVQEEVARAVVRELRVALSGDTPQQLVRSRTQNLEAHDRVLRAGFEARGRTHEGLLRARALLESALTLDTAYAEAWATRATLLETMAIFRDAQSPDDLRQARFSAERAAALDPLSADAQAALGSLLFRFDWQWAEAEGHIRRAISLNPALVAAHLTLSRVLRSVGRFAEARAELAAADRLDPSMAERGLARGRISFFAREYERAIRETLAYPKDSTARTYHVWLAQAYIGAGRFREAEELLRGPLGSDPGDPVTRVYLLAMTGRADSARSLFRAAEQPQPSGPSLDAEAYVALGARERALDRIERAVADHDPLVVDLKVNPWLDPIRNEPRFEAIMQRLAFPP